MSGVLSILRSNPLAAIAPASDAARLADLAANPADYAIPGFALKIGEWLQLFNQEKGRRLKNRAITALAAAGAALFLYQRYQKYKRQSARSKAYTAATLNAIANHTPIPPPPTASPVFGDLDSLGDQLIHVPQATTLEPTAERANGEKSKPEAGGPNDKKRIAVDALFFRRLAKILNIVIPSVYSTEMGYLIILTILLFARTFFSIYIAEMLGSNAQAMVTRKWGKMWRGIKMFAVVTIPASGVNAGLKFFTEMVSLRFRKRLSEFVHDQYLEGTNFYKAVNLGGSERIDNADQRVTADIKDFSDEIAALYASLLKPLLDVILFTYRLKTILGWQGPAAMHSYFVLSAIVKKKLMPNLGKLVARESELEGFYRTAHNRLITNSEEIAFYDGSKKEKVIINDALQRIYQHISYARYVKALIGVFDGLLVKYYASIAGYCTLLSPFIFNVAGNAQATTDELTRDYIRNSQYLGQLSTAVAALVMVGNKLTSIAGYTSRVSELLEQVKHLNDVGNVPFEIKPEVPHVVEPVQEGSAYTSFIQSWKARCDEQAQLRKEIRQKASSVDGVVHVSHIEGGGDLKEGENITFEHVDIVSPEGKLLVKDLNFEVTKGTNVMVTGPNGVGKSSLFRIIGELWPLHSGVLTKPNKEEILFVPQKPYLVLGTLRDQIIYPHEKADMDKLNVTDDDLAKLLSIVDPARNILTEWSFDTVKDWFHAFSGGQKQRIAMARLFYHRPKFAILDECTSAVSDEVEGTIYSTCRQMGITIFTVSHRPTLAKYHDVVLRFLGETKWETVKIDANAEIEKERKERERFNNLNSSNANASSSSASSTTAPSSSPPTSSSSAAAPVAAIASVAATETVAAATHVATPASITKAATPASVVDSAPDSNGASTIAEPAVDAAATEAESAANGNSHHHTSVNKHMNHGKKKKGKH